jgi:hypothetical protein
MKKIKWPDGKRFAFTVFDDTDSCSIQNGPIVYQLLSGLGFKTTKSVWPVKGLLKPHTGGTTCEDRAYLEWVQELQTRGFEIALHNVTFHTSSRQEIIRGLDLFYEYFGSFPRIHVNHADCQDNLYWGDARLGGLNRWIYSILTREKNKGRFQGHDPDSRLFWGDICQGTIKYVRNFIFPGINTLKACPQMPYHDKERPFVNYWFASSPGSNVDLFNKTISEKNQDRLEDEGGACIMYTHFGSNFVKDGKLNTEFSWLMARLAGKNGWFVPVSTLLDYLLDVNEHHCISPSERSWLETRWLMGKIAAF